MRGKRIGQPEKRRELGAIKARAKHPDRHMGALTGDCTDSRIVERIVKIRQQFHNILREIIIGFHMPPKCMSGCAVGTGGATKPQIDTPGIECCKGSKLLGNHQRCMIGQHNAARTYPNGLRVRSDVAYDHRRCRTGDTGHVVMFCQPIAVISVFLGMACKVECVAQCVSGCPTFRNWRQIEQREFVHLWPPFLVSAYSGHDLNAPYAHFYK